MSHFQLSEDESRLEWVGKSATTKHVPCARIVDVLPGRASDLFRRAASKADEHPPELCLSVLYHETEKDATRGAKPRTLDLVCEDEAQATLWIRGLLVARDRARAPRPDANPKMHAATAFLVAKAARKFASFKGASSSSSASAADDDDEPLCEPRDILVWGRIPACFASARDPSASASGGEWAHLLLPTEVPGAEGLDATSASLGDRHAVVVARSGAVYSWGDAADGRLGRGRGDGERATPSRIPREFAHRRHENQRERDGERDGDGETNLPLGTLSSLEVCCGGARSVLKDAAGRMHAWGDGWLGVASVDRQWSPARAPAHCPRVTAVACGAYHAAAVAEDGGVWTWGEGAFGALGHGAGARRASTPTPRRVAGLTGRRALSVSCGVWHTAAIALASSDATATASATDAVGTDPAGDLWTWGDADGGKLGLGDGAASTDTPTMAARPPEGEVNFRSVSCGQWHTLALDASGGVWVCGSVGKAGGTESTVPARVAFPARIRHLASGDLHAAATAEDGAGLYTWGRGRRGALGHGGVGDEPAPRLVRRLDGRVVFLATCGPESTAAVVSPRTMTRREKAELAKAPMRFKSARGKWAAAAGAAAAVGATKRAAARSSATSSAAPSLAASRSPSRENLLASSAASTPRDAKRHATPPKDAKRHATPPRAPIMHDERPIGAGAAGGAGVAGASGSAEGSSSVVAAALRVALAEAASAARERDALRSEVAELRAAAKRAAAGGTAARDATTVSSNAARDAATTAVSEPSGSSRALREVETRDAACSTGSLTLERDRAVAARIAAEAAAEAAAIDAEAAAAELRAKTAALEERVVLAEFELETLRAERELAARKERAEALETAMDEAQTPPEEDAPRGDEMAPEDEAEEPAPEAEDEPRPAPPSHPSRRPSVPSPRRRTPPTSPPTGSTRRPGSPLSPLRADTRGHLHVDPNVGEADPSRRSDPTPLPRASTGAGPDGAAEWVEEVEPGVFLTVAVDASGRHVLRRVRFSRRRFGDGEANEWWAKHRVRVIRARGLRVQRQRGDENKGR